MFRETLNIDYVELAFKEYDTQLSKTARSLVESVADSFRPISFGSATAGESATNLVHSDVDFVLGTRLFELYLGLQQFYGLGKEFKGDDLTSSDNESCLSEASSTRYVDL